MHDDTIIPVAAGLAIGIAFLVIVTVMVAPLTAFADVKLKEEYGDKLGQQRAIDVLLTDPDVRAFIAEKNFEVWTYGMNYPQASLNEGVCDKDECTLIGIRERNADSSTDCALITFVNVETRQVDDVQYFTPCDIENR